MGKRGVWSTAFVLMVCTPQGAVRAQEHGAPSAAAQAQAEDSASERELAREASLEVLERLMRARHPALHGAEARTQAASLAARERAGRPPPELMYQQWAVPLERPYDLGRANMIMVGARVPVPSRAVRKAEALAARRAAEAAGHERASTANDLLWELRTTYAEYVRAGQELALHHEHARLVQDLYELGKVAYSANQASASALHATRVALGRLHSDIATLESELELARVRLNLLAGRPARAPLGPPREKKLSFALPEKATRPELAQQTTRVAAQRAELRAAELTARRPTWVVGVDYTAMPEHDDRRRYGAMVSMTLPWFSDALRARVERARYEQRAEEAELASTALALALEQEEARLALEAAERAHHLVEHEWLRHALEAYEIEREAWAAGQSDARAVLERLDGLLEARMALVRAERDVAVRKVTLARALGGGP